MSISLDRAVAERAPTSPFEAEPTTVWRTWLVRTSRHGPDREPILTGVFGFPWRGPDIDAKCTIQVLDVTASRPGRARIDRHHRTIPDPSCTCGIYGSTDLLEIPAADLLPSGVPVVTGFVELSGRLLARTTTRRAQHARIVGPLTLGPGRPPPATRLLRRAGFDPQPSRVVSEREGFRVVWGAGRVGTAYAEWLTASSAALAGRYGVDVIMSRPIAEPQRPTNPDIS